jgi:hypothetical protein
MAEDYGKPETEAERRAREQDEYWEKVAAQGGGGKYWPEMKRRQARQTEMAEIPPPAGIDPDETDPLVIIYAAIQANTNGMKEAAAQAKASRSEVAASDRQLGQQLETLKKYVLDNTTAIGTLTYTEERIANAEAAKFLWGVGGFLVGMTVLEAGQFLWQHFFG